MQSNLRMTTIASCWSLPVVTLTEQNLQSPGRWVYEHVCKRFSWLGYLMWEDILRTFRKQAEHHHSLLSGSWLWLQCDHLPQLLMPWLPHHDGGVPWTLSQNKPFSLKLPLSEYLVTATEKETKTHSIWELYNYFNLSLLNKFEDSINISTLQKKGLNLKTQTHALVSWIQSAWSSAMVLCSI